MSVGLPVDNLPAGVQDRPDIELIKSLNTKFTILSSFISTVYSNTNYLLINLLFGPAIPYSLIYFFIILPIRYQNVNVDFVIKLFN